MISALGRWSSNEMPEWALEQDPVFFFFFKREISDLTQYHVFLTEQFSAAERLGQRAGSVGKGAYCQG